MKKTSVIVISLLIVIAVGLFFLPEGEESKNQDLWENATYKESTTLGEGENTLIVTVGAGDKSIDFTIKTDETVVGAALKEHNLVEGVESETGLYVKIANGIEADYDKDKYFWGFYKDGEMMPTGIDSTQFKDGDRFELVRTK